MRKYIFLFAIALLPLIIVGCDDSSGKVNEETGLPEQMTWSVYETGASGYAEMSAIADMLTSEYGTNVRLLPSSTGVGRMIPLKEEKASMAKLGDESQFAFEGTEEFAEEEWGPQNIRAIWSPITQYGFAVREKDGIDKIEDLKGKKFPYFPGNPSVNVKSEAILAFGGLTWDDVNVVELTDYSDQNEALVQGEIDAVSGIPSSSAFYETESKEDIKWLEMDSDDTEGWDQVEEVAPWLFSETRDDGAGMDKDTELVGYGYSIGGYEDTDNVYEFLEAMDEGFDEFKDSVPEAYLYDKDEVLSEPQGIPFHEETIEFFKDNDMWDDEKQEKNDELVERFDNLSDAWDKVTEEAEDKNISEDEFPEFWLDKKEDLIED